MTSQLSLPETIEDVPQLEELLSRPSQGVIETMGRLEGDIIFLGVAGKMGPTLARMAKRASEAANVSRKIIGVARFSSSELRDQLEAQGIETIKADLLDRKQLEKLPRLPNVVYMAAKKFGSTGQESLTWAMNALLPGLVFEHFHDCRAIAFSTGNVYRRMPIDSPGSEEADELGPVGEYAMSALSRERIYEYCSGTYNVPMSILRLNYANELRYGVIVDLAEKIARRETIDLTMGYFNAIWQGDANAMSLQAFDHVETPPWNINLAGPKVMSVRTTCQQLAERMNCEVNFQGEEAPDALLSNGKKSYQHFGIPEVPEERLIDWIADWVLRGGESLGKATHFEVRDGKF